MSDQIASDHEVSDQLPAVSRETEYLTEYEQIQRELMQIMECYLMGQCNTLKSEQLQLLCDSMFKAMAGSFNFNQQGNGRISYRYALRNLCIRLTFREVVPSDLLALSERQAFREFSKYIVKFETRTLKWYQSGAPVTLSKADKLLLMAKRTVEDIPKSHGALKNIILHNQQ